MPDPNCKFKINGIYKTVYDELKNERDYQVSRWGNDLDDKWKDSELIYGAISYLHDSLENEQKAEKYWPDSWKEIFGTARPPAKKDFRDHLIKATAMLIAEIERIDRRS